MNTKKTKIMIIMMIAALFMSIGYAVLYTQLDIRGVSTITDTWGIEITGVTSSATGRAYHVSAPTYSGTSATFNVGLKEPGDKMVLTVSVKNTGSLSAILDNIDAKSSGTSIITYELSGIQEKTKLAAGASISFQITIEFDIDAKEIPDDPVKELLVNLNYVQDDGQTLTPADPSIEGENSLASTVLLSNVAKSVDGIDFEEESPRISSYTTTTSSTTTNLSFTASSTYYFATGYTFDELSGIFKLSGTIISSTWANMANRYDQYPYTLQAASSTGTSSTGVYKMTGYISNTSGISYHTGRQANYLNDNGQGLYYTTTNTEGGKRTYFFRGAVENNYVTFANNLWRIVRINEDGSVRLIKQTVISSKAFNTGNDNAYLGYMYGAAGATTYEAAHANTTDSEIKKALDTWYTSNLASYSSYLADAGFCNERKLGTGLGYGTEVTFYGIEGGSIPTVPRFTCSQTSDLFTTTTGSKGNKKLTNPIGIITADEVIAAGGDFGTNNTEYYLYNGTSFWTMTPHGYYTSASYMYYVSSTGSLSNGGTSSTQGIRPVINISNAVKVTGGDGSSSSPYTLGLS